MKKIIYLLSLVLLVGCTAKKDIAVVTSTPAPTPTSTLITTPTPPATLDDVDWSTKVLYFLCPREGASYKYYRQDVDEQYIQLSLVIYPYENINYITFVVDSSSIRYFKGIVNKIDTDFYSYYGYIYTADEMQEEYDKNLINEVYDDSYIKYFKYEDGYIYVYPDGLTMEEMKTYQFEEEGCKFMSSIKSRDVK